MTRFAHRRNPLTPAYSVLVSVRRCNYRPRYVPCIDHFCRSVHVCADLGDHVRLFAEHQSSPRQSNDHPGFNHAGVKFLAPIAPETTLYSGISINSSIDTNKVNVDAPLVSIGVEDGDEDLKVFFEYLADVSKIDDGRFSIGLKMYFR